MFSTTPVCPPLDENSNQSFLSDVYQPKMDNSSSTSSSQQVSPPHTSSLRTEDSQPPMLGQESVDGTCMMTLFFLMLHIMSVIKKKQTKKIDSVFVNKNITTTPVISWPGSTLRLVCPIVKFPHVTHSGVSCINSAFLYPSKLYQQGHNLTLLCESRASSFRTGGGR